MTEDDPSETAGGSSGSDVTRRTLLKGAALGGTTLWLPGTAFAASASPLAGVRRLAAAVRKSDVKHSYRNRLIMVLTKAEDALIEGRPALARAFPALVAAMAG